MSTLRLLLLALVPGLVFGAPEKPNIVLILADDLGIECLASYGGASYRTPNLDRLARDGMRFTHCFSNPTCSPTRATLLTGQYPFRHGIREVIYRPDRHRDLWLRTDRPSVARQLRDAGYATAIAGKWQLSFLHERNTVNDFGFDRYQCWQIFREDGAKTRRFLKPHFIRDGRIIADESEGRYGPDLNAEFLIDFIKDQAAQETPFFAYHTCLLPHFPWVPTPDSEDQRDPLDGATDLGNLQFFPDMVAYLDTLVGRILRTLDEQGIAETTVVIFAADNGTDQRVTSRLENGRSVKGGKGTMTDRGTRVPLLVRWPGTVAKGSTCDDLIDFTDFLPTLCGIAGAPLPEATLDGRSFLPRLRGGPGRPRDWIHVENKGERHVRDRSHILNNRNDLRPVVDLWQAPAKPVPGPGTAEEQQARKRLQDAFKELTRQGTPGP